MEHRPGSAQVKNHRPIVSKFVIFSFNFMFFKNIDKRCKQERERVLSLILKSTKLKILKNKKFVILILFK